MESSPPPKPRGRPEGKKPKHVRGRGSHRAGAGVNKKGGWERPNETGHWEREWP